ncbi:hypothetical protein GALMADRAFT_146292 [Galerina marginata CBS 339.88]|uniref:Uncharacterized protein n=1 Tax=Galerina marginata (strain CBS 339.88) TaxID=685588 RepID=A0A067SLR0_GALM3|nr:hypothetical protein GALMADRAFT_146292 [Galerina marginata CBS 339.88]
MHPPPRLLPRIFQPQFVTSVSAGLVAPHLRLWLVQASALLLIVPRPNICVETVGALVGALCLPPSSDRALGSGNPSIFPTTNLSRTLYSSPTHSPHNDISTHHPTSARAFSSRTIEACLFALDDFARPGLLGQVLGLRFRLLHYPPAGAQPAPISRTSSYPPPAGIGDSTLRTLRPFYSREVIEVVVDAGGLYVDYHRSGSFSDAQHADDPERNQDEDQNQELGYLDDELNRACASLGLHFSTQQSLLTASTGHTASTSTPLSLTSSMRVRVRLVDRRRFARPWATPCRHCCRCPTDSTTLNDIDADVAAYYQGLLHALPRLLSSPPTSTWLTQLLVHLLNHRIWSMPPHLVDMAEAVTLPPSPRAASTWKMWPPLLPHPLSPD